MKEKGRNVEHKNSLFGEHFLNIWTKGPVLLIVGPWVQYAENVFQVSRAVPPFLNHFFGRDGFEPLKI